MYQQKIGWKLCSVPTHNKEEIEKFCKEEKCITNRLICHKCLTEEHHISHISKLEQIKKLPKYFEDYRNNCEQFKKQLASHVNKVEDSMKNILLLFQESYEVENINDLTPKQLGWSLSKTFQFENYIKKEIMERINFAFHQLNEILTDINEELQLQNINASQNYYIEGFALYEKDQYENALNYIDQSIKLNPRGLQGLWCKGQCLRMLDKETEALIWLEKALQIDPNNVDSLFSKGECLRILQKESEALKFQEKAIQIQPTHIGALYSAGECLRELGRKEESLVYLTKSLSLNPNHVRSLGSMGACLADLGKYKEAIIFYDKALQLDPSYVFSANGKSKNIQLKSQEFCLSKTK